MDVMSEVAQILDDSVCGFLSSFLSLSVPSSLGNLGENNLTLSNSKQMIHPNTF